MTPPRATPPTPMIAVRISVIVSILDRDDNAHYARNGGKWVSGTIQWTKTATSTDNLSITGCLDFDIMTAFLYIDWTNRGEFNSPAWSAVSIAKIKGIRSTLNEVQVPCIENTGETEAGAPL
jgi:hypothetical protein